MNSLSRQRVLAVAPHPDDETLGCGGTLLRHIAKGDEVQWLIVTGIEQATSFTDERKAQRRSEIEVVAQAYGFSKVHNLNFPTACLDTLPKGDLVKAIADVIKTEDPTTVYLPYRNDIHSDHAAVFDAVVSATKNFRAPSVRGLYAYETLSETEFGLRPDDPGFRPNLLMDITGHLDRKVDIMKYYASELAPFPFPRSVECMRAQAALRGSQAGVTAAEAFMVLKEIR